MSKYDYKIKVECIKIVKSVVATLKKDYFLPIINVRFRLVIMLSPSKDFPKGFMISVSSIKYFTK